MDVLSWNKTPQRLVFLNVPCQFTIDDIHQLPISIFVCHSHTLPCNIHGDVCTSLYVWRHLQFNTDNRLTDTSVADIFLFQLSYQYKFITFSSVSVFNNFPVSVLSIFPFWLQLQFSSVSLQ